jgi:endo-alpha-1,4-polygalactosaminidase (GH114 family)
MSEKPTEKRPWSLRRKILFGIIALLVVLGLALGIGLGLTLGGNDNDKGDDDQPSLTPLPSPNSTLPWTPKVNDTWQIVLSRPLLLSSSATSTTPDVSIFDIDLFDTPVATIQQLHKLGKKVICYFSAGSYEEWRADAKDFKSGDLGKQLDGWPGEKWVKLGGENVRAIMKKRIEMARDKGCDGVDPDNVDGYVCPSHPLLQYKYSHAVQGNDNGLGLTTSDSVNFIQFLSSVTRPLNLTLGLKNAGSIVPAVLPLVDFAVNEQCVKYNECSTFQRFVAAGKPVFHIEYPAGDGELQQNVEADGFSEDTKKKFCNADGSHGFSTVLKKMKLDGWVEFCDGKIQNTAVEANTAEH